jgi:hypothetical protein
MELKITIKGIGYNVGTCGWLKTGLENGSIEIVEGVSNSGSHGLWLHHSGDKSQTLALWDPYDLQNTHPDLVGYDVAPRDSDCGWNIGDAVPWTDAAWAVIEEIAHAWVRHVTERRANDERSLITVSFSKTL